MLEQPLVTVVSARTGTRGADILQAMRELNEQRRRGADGRVLELDFCLLGADDKSRGLFLRDCGRGVRLGSFSLCCVRGAEGVWELPVSDKFRGGSNGRCFVRAAEAILAMIRRGERWVNKRGEFMEEAWGQRRTVKPAKPCLSSAERRRAKRALGREDGPCCWQRAG